MESEGLGLAGVLTIVFVVLKLIGVIDWSWWWVLSPIWISIGLFILVAGITWFISSEAVSTSYETRSTFITKCGCVVHYHIIKKRR